SPGPARAPAPAATITTPTSGGKPSGEVTDAVHRDHVETGQDHARAGREEGAPEALAHLLAQPPPQTRDEANLAAQPPPPAEPDTPLVRPARNAAAGSATGSRPAPVMANTPTSSTQPNRFFTARRMRWSSVLSPSK